MFHVNKYVTFALEKTPQESWLGLRNMQIWSSSFLIQTSFLEKFLLWMQLPQNQGICHGDVVISMLFDRNIHMYIYIWIYRLVADDSDSKCWILLGWMTHAIAGYIILVVYHLSGEMNYRNIYYHLGGVFTYFLRSPRSLGKWSNLKNIFQIFLKPPTSHTLVGNLTS